MSRETYFRAWDTYNEAWADEYLAIAEDGHVIEIKDDGTTEYWKDRFIIEFDTGLKDENGKEIYEGDIVDYNDDGDCIGYVVYNAPHYEIMEKIGYPCWLKGGPHQRVIGNIHENPELLEHKG